jgi:hypothetical protein
MNVASPLESASECIRASYRVPLLIITRTSAVEVLLTFLEAAGRNSAIANDLPDPTRL